MSKLLTGKTAIVYGAGAIGGAIAAAFAEEGAAVFVADKAQGALDNVANNIKGKGGSVETAVVDALDKEAVEAFVDGVAKKTGRVDVSFCATSTHKPGGEQGAALSEVSFEDFSMPIVDYTKAHLFTINAATKHMIPQGSGVIMGITATPSHIPYPFMAGFPPAWAAVEALLRVAAAEMGPHGIRTVCLHSAGSPESAKSIGKTLSQLPQVKERIDGWEARSAARNLLNHRPTLKEVGDMAAFMASDKAGATTGARVNLTGGVVND